MLNLAHRVLNLALDLTASQPPSAQNEPAEAIIEDLPHPLEQKRRGLRQEAVTQVVNGEAKPVERGPSTVLRVGRQPDIDAGGDTRRLMDRQRSRSQYVELARETTDRMFVVLAEFGDERAPDYPDQDTDPNTPGPVRFDGPDHNEIPKPDRSVDNSTIWQPDYDRAHYEQVYFGEGDDVESVKEYYERQSSGRYSIDGPVTDWVKVRYNQARYGRSGGFPCASIVCSNTWDLLAEAVDQWVADKQAAGMTDDEIAAELATFDEWDRYDFDGDGNFNERDGYINHFQIVRAGGDEADGDPIYGEDAIWSHRWYAFFNGIGQQGPDGNPLGGTEIGDTGVWIGDYTIQPENGGLGVFVHEYGHDLDHYYLASYRAYLSYDRYLRTGPYNFGFTPEKPDLVEHFPYQDGLLVSYWNTSQSDNNTSQHPREGLNGQPSWVRGRRAQPVFNDRRSYWDAEQPNVGVKVPNAGVRIRVQRQRKQSMRIRIGSTN